MPQAFSREEDNRCLMCGKTREQVKKLLLGIHGGICLDCVELCNEVVREVTRNEAQKSKMADQESSDPVRSEPMTEESKPSTTDSEPS